MAYHESLFLFLYQSINWHVVSITVKLATNLLNSASQLSLFYFVLKRGLLGYHFPHLISPGSLSKEKMKVLSLHTWAGIWIMAAAFIKILPSLP